MAKILIVDDEPLTIEMLATFLRIIGHETLEALNAHQAWDKLAIQTPDAALLDINLPDQNGLDICREMRTRPELASMAIIVISATAPPMIKEAKAAGANDYLAKPISLTNLKTVLANAGIK